MKSNALVSFLCRLRIFYNETHYTGIPAMTTQYGLVRERERETSGWGSPAVVLHIICLYPVQVLMHPVVLPWLSQQRFLLSITQAHKFSFHR